MYHIIAGHLIFVFSPEDFHLTVYIGVVMNVVIRSFKQNEFYYTNF